MLSIITDQNIPFNVKIVSNGESYGLNNCLTHEKDDPLVEFYDTRYANRKGFGPKGQFVSRYYLSTLLERMDGYGLDLMGYEPSWKIDRKAMKVVMSFLRAYSK